MTGTPSNPYGLQVRERTCPDVPTEVQQSLTRLVVDASEVPTDGKSPEQVATEALNAIYESMTALVQSDPELADWATDLIEITSTTPISRGAVISSKNWEVTSLARSVILDALRSWCLLGDWSARKVGAAEMVLRLIEEEADFDPINNLADKALLERALKDQESVPA